MRVIRVLRNLATLFVFTAVAVSGASAQEMTGPFHLWLLNNEARMFEILGNDRRVIERMNMPVACFPGLPMPSPRIEEKLYKIHLGFFRLFPEFNAVFGLARKYGSGRFAKVFEKARPGYPALAAIRGIPAWPVRFLQPVLDKRFQESFFAVQGISKDRDVDLDQRLTSAMAGLSDSDRRLLAAYLETFLALYPTNQASRILAGMVKNGVNKDFAKGLAALVGESGTASGTPAKSPEGEQAGSVDGSGSVGTSTGTTSDAASGTDLPPDSGISSSGGTPIGSTGVPDSTISSPGDAPVGSGTDSGVGSDISTVGDEDPFKIMDK